MNVFPRTGLAVLAALLLAGNAAAAPRIAVLNFELNDITSLPNTADEQRRTATFAPLLSQQLKTLGAYELVDIPVAAQTAANPSLGYLFNFYGLAAQLGQQYGADWVIIGQHSKPSFLFSYLMAEVVEVKQQKLIGSFAIELKGTHEKVTQRGVKNLAQRIVELLGRDGG